MEEEESKQAQHKIENFDVVVNRASCNEPYSIDNLLVEANAIVKPFDDNFICKICLEIAKPPPKKCAECEAIFCSACVFRWNAMGNTKCPAGCNMDPVQVIQLSRFERNHLGKMKFNCIKCE